MHSIYQEFEASIDDHVVVITLSGGILHARTTQLDDVSPVRDVTTEAFVRRS